MPKISIAIPFRDEALTLPAAIRTVFAQTFTDWELLLVDDGSRDASLTIARKVQDARVRVVSDGTQKGLPARLNQIVAEAGCELVARMDADDVMHPDRLRRQLALLDADPSLDCVGTDVVYALPGRAPIIASIPPPRHGADVLARVGVPHATMLARRTFLQQHPYDEAFTRAEDRELFCRTWGELRFASVHAPLYVVDPDVRSRAFLRNYLESMRQNREIYLRHGPRLVGLAQTGRAMFGSYAREVAYRAAATVGALDALVWRRGRPATHDELRLINEAREASRDTSVPGLD